MDRHIKRQIEGLKDRHRRGTDRQIKRDTGGDTVFILVREE